MYKSPNEIALEQKIEELQKQVKELEDFEGTVTMEIGLMMFSMIAESPDLAQKSFDKLTNLIGERVKLKVKRNRL